MNENEIAIVDEKSIEGMVYEIRGQLVMLDYDLARVYGYETKGVNEQVKNNEDRFPKEFAFCLTDAEVRSLLRSKKSTTKVLSSLRRYNPCAFSEQRKNNEDRFPEEFRFRLTRGESRIW